VSAFPKGPVIPLLPSPTTEAANRMSSFLTLPLVGREVSVAGLRRLYPCDNY
jgi:hypothetical protein